MGVRKETSDAFTGIGLLVTDMSTMYQLYRFATVAFHLMYEGAAAHYFRILPVGE
jgi:hypothetical protein